MQHLNQTTILLFFSSDYIKEISVPQSSLSVLLHFGSNSQMQEVYMKYIGKQNFFLNKYSPKLGDQDCTVFYKLMNSNFTCCFVQIQNLISQPKRRTQIEGFKNRPLKRGTNRGWKQLLKKQIHNLHSSPNNITAIKSNRVGHVACMQGMIEEYEILVADEKGPLGKPRHTTQMGRKY